MYAWADKYPWHRRFVVTECAKWVSANVGMWAPNEWVQMSFGAHIPTEDICTHLIWHMPTFALMSFGAHIPICTHSECEHSDICPHGMYQMSGCKCLLFKKIDCDILECASSMKYAQLDIYVGAKRPVTSTFMSIQELMNLWPSSPK